MPSRIETLHCSVLALFVITCCLMTATSATIAEGRADPIDPRLAAQYFDEARTVSEQDGGRLWKVSLYGPMMCADSRTRFVVANQADSEKRLQARDGVFAGTLPAEIGIANTAVTWAGVTWTMVMWPVSPYRQERERLMMHESFHRIQQSIGLPASDAVRNAQTPARTGNAGSR